MRVLHFLQYNNAVPVGLGIIFLGASGVFAATNPDALYSATEQIVSVDNTYISNKDLSSYTPTVQILSVTEDSDNYYVAYRLTTINVVDAVWRDVVEDRKMTIARGTLGEYGDLGLYVTEQLKQVIDYQLAYLREVQEIERRNVTNKVVATAYAGLIGAMLDTTTETIAGYEPVVTPPPPPLPDVPPTNVGAPPSGDGQVQNPPTQQGGDNPSPPASPQINGPGAPVLQLLGANPHLVGIGEVFEDLGVVVTDDSGALLTVRKYVDGILADGPVVIDTAVPREFHIRYEATDEESNIGAIERAVQVIEQTPGGNASEQTATPEPTNEAGSQENSNVPSSPETSGQPTEPEVVQTESVIPEEVSPIAAPDPEPLPATEPEQNVTPEPVVPDPAI